MGAIGPEGDPPQVFFHDAWGEIPMIHVWAWMPPLNLAFGGVLRVISWDLWKR